METRWLYRTSDDFAELREKADGVCVIPMGCVEKHGLHLPLGADILQAEYLAYQASKLETFCVFPGFTFGDVPCPGPIEPVGCTPPGTVTVSLELQMKLLEELCCQISRNGYKKIIIYNGHGGNIPWLNTFLRSLSGKKHDFAVCTVTLELIAPHVLAEHLEANGSGSIPELTADDEKLLLRYHAEEMLNGHACMGETANMMGIAPESVHLDRLGIESGLPTGKSRTLRDAGLYPVNGGWDLEYPNAYQGHDPIGCNERIGKAALRFEAERLAKAVAVYKKDTTLLEHLAYMQKGM